MFKLKILQPHEISKDWLDYSSLVKFQRCPRAYFWAHIMNIKPSTQPVALINGKAYHEGIAIYHECRKIGMSHLEAIEKGIEAALVIIREITIEDAKRNSSVCESTLRGYFAQWENEFFITKTIETGGAIDLDDFVFIFRIDRIVDMNSSLFKGLGVIETKTTTIMGSKWQKRGKPNLQIEGYMFGASVLLGEDILNGVLDVIHIHDNPSRRETPFRIITSRSHAELEAWHHNIVKWWGRIKVCKKENFFPMTTENCYPLLGMECEYTSLCAKYPNPHIFVNEIEIPDEYMIDEWKPYEF